ncbi:MAG: SDR family oxidoreductase [Burkholderiaceae bacterium]
MSTPEQLFSLAGRKALVTGGSRGLGLQISEALASAGAEVIISARKQNELDTAVAHLQGLGATASAISADMSKPDSVTALAEQAVEQAGHLDILVNNAGAVWVAKAEEHPLEAWQKLVNINLTGIFVLTQRVAQLSMIPRRYGRVLNVASIAGLRGNQLGTNETLAYNTTKGGVVNFTRTLAGEWGQYGITVNALAPGFFPTKMTNHALDTLEETLKSAAPLNRLGDSEDLKGASLLFCSEAGKHISGQILAIDGGVSAV